MTSFDMFVILADMRTGSNFLEANMNRIDGVTCHGEAFNPAFIGDPKAEAVLDITQEQRDADPEVLLEAMRGAPGLNGFRFFSTHDPRVLATCLDDPRCAKIVLTRNPIDSFVSLRIAQATGQWKLTNASHLRTDPVVFDTEGFEAHLESTQAFQVRILNTLQRTGQTAFYIAYEDLQDIAVLNGLAMFLGVSGRIDKLDRKLKKQNPEPLDHKVENFAEMEQALARFDRFNLSRTPNFEPRRGPGIPTYVAAPLSALLHVPLRSGPEEAVHAWLARLDDAPETDLRRDFSQKTLRDWMRDHPGFRSFAVLRHPVARAHAAFCDKILSQGPGSFPEVRATLRKVHRMPLPELNPEGGLNLAEHRAAFLSFLNFLRNNLSGQTNLRTDPAWAGQMVLLEGINQFAAPHMLVHEDRMQDDLTYLAAQVGKAAPEVGDTNHPDHATLAAIYDAEIETATRQAYARDYLVFGFSDWGQAA